MSIIKKHHTVIDSKGLAVIYPCFHSIFVCANDFNIFKKGKEYQIIGFGNSRDKNNVKHPTW